MKEIDDLFEVSAVTPEGLNLVGRGANPGFRIPVYQRPYDWGEDNILRLVSSMFTGLDRLTESTKADAFTFLGSVILVNEDTQEKTFEGVSFSIVDGQQRITTLSLIACAIIERLRALFANLPTLPAEINGWLKAEMDFVERSLIKMVVGRQDTGGDRTFPFPRIIRNQDTRGKSVKEQELKSSISQFLFAFSEFYSSTKTAFIPPALPNSRESRRILENFSYIKDLIVSLNDKDWYESSDCEFLAPEKFGRAGLKKLHEKIKENLETDGEKEIAAIRKFDDVHAFYRTLLLAGYVRSCVGITVVRTDDETAAFDIFDALNTTGEPLSALEVLKPVVVNFLDSDKSHPGYSSSDAEAAFRTLDEIFEDEAYTSAQDKQDETKRAVVTAALVIAGEKISEKLSIQRSQMRKYFATAAHKNAKTAEQFSLKLAQTAKFRHDYWNDRQFQRLSLIHRDQSECNELKFLFRFISDMKTSMALPILIRFWAIGARNDDFKDFLAATRAVTAFIALRRAATEKTEGIDTCFRDLMATPKAGRKYGFCTGTTFENNDPKLSDLKAALRKNLDSKKLKFSAGTDRSNWINHCVDVPMYSAGQPLAKFLLLAAHNKTDVDKANPALPTRSGVVVAEEREFLSYERWSDPRYKTVEHIAPNAAGAVGWPTDVLNNARIRNSLGNLTLLPVRENSHISNAEWEKKKLFFAALSSKNDADRETKLKHAETALSKPFRKTTWQVVKSSARLSILDGLDQAETWNKSLIEERSRRLLGLAWDEIWPWIE
ncbi:DUF262 domain-containing protein [Ruegeria arenilitoris]|uniref:DUF262 domain-containing protein n=1 Tax=Ruegeria arenilitoris TaxID=1173585 RepID=UPI00147D527C|nr:DUF262 domain-containing HNH endonuclease family protein [Ruegeria arenilitoris]